MQLLFFIFELHAFVAESSRHTIYNNNNYCSPQGQYNRRENCEMLVAITFYATARFQTANPPINNHEYGIYLICQSVENNGLLLPSSSLIWLNDEGEIMCPKQKIYDLVNRSKILCLEIYMLFICSWKTLYVASVGNSQVTSILKIAPFRALHCAHAIWEGWETVRGCHVVILLRNYMYIILKIYAYD